MINNSVLKLLNSELELFKKNFKSSKFQKSNFILFYLKKNDKKMKKYINMTKIYFIVMRTI